MKAFLIFTIIAAFINVIWHLICFQKGEFPQRTYATESVNVVENTAVLVWAIVLLVGAW